MDFGSWIVWELVNNVNLRSDLDYWVIESNQPESLILAQSERWRQA